MNNNSCTRTYYTIESSMWIDPIHPSQRGYWSASGSGGYCHTISAAYIRLKEDLEIAIKNKCDLSKVKFTIKKIITIESDEEEYTGSDFTAFMLKTV
jgi:hypothetical protein